MRGFVVGLAAAAATATAWALAAGCGGSGGKPEAPKPAALADDAAAVVNGEAISMADYKDRMERQSPYVRNRYNTLERKEEFLDNMVRFELMAQEAKRRGLDQDPEVQRAAKQVMIQRLTRLEFDEQLDKAGIPEEELKAYYEAHASEFQRPAMIRASHVLIAVAPDADKATVDAARAKALQALGEARRAKDETGAFRKLAKKYSDDAKTKNRGGDLGYFAKTADGGPMPQAFSDAAWKLEHVNDLSDVVRSEQGFHVIRLTGTREAINRSFEDVKTQLQNRLYKDKRSERFDAFVAQLRAQAKVEVNRAALERYNPADAEAKGPGRPKTAQDEHGEADAPDGLPPTAE